MSPFLKASIPCDTRDRGDSVSSKIAMDSAEGSLDASEALVSIKLLWEEKLTRATLLGVNRATMRKMMIMMPINWTTGGV